MRIDSNEIDIIENKDNFVTDEGDVYIENINLENPAREGIEKGNAIGDNEHEIKAEQQHDNEHNDSDSQRSYHSSDSDLAYEKYAMVKRTSMFVPDVNPPETKA